MTTDICTNAFGDRYVKGIGDGIFDQASAESLFAKYLDPNLFNPDCLHIMVGSDSGLLIDFIQRQALPPGSAYLFIEPAMLLSAVEALVPGLKASTTMALCTPEHWVSTAMSLNLETYVLKKSVLIHPCLSSKRAARALYQPLIDRVLLELDQTAYSIKEPLSSGEKIAANLANLSENHESIKTLFNCFPGQTAIVLGAGPSLDGQLEWIRQHRQQLYIIAASRLCKYLVEKDLPPDMVVSVDWQGINYEQSKGLFDLPKDTILVHSSQVSPQLVAQWPGPHVYMGQLLPWKSPLNDPDNQYTGGPTVSNGALYVAGLMGFSTILLSGVDLCKPEGASTHAGSLTLDKSNTFIHQVETYSGIQATSNLHMQHASQILSEQAKSLPNCQVINLSENASKLEGISHQACHVISLPPIDSDQWKQIPYTDSAKKRIAHNESIQVEIERVSKDLRNLTNTCKKAIQLNKAMYKRDKSGNLNPQAKNKLNNLKARMDKDYDHLLPTVRELGIEKFINAMTTRDVNQFTDKEREYLGNRFYTAFKSGSVALTELLADSEQRLSSRLDEDSENPDFSKLFHQWQMDKQFGRSKVWKQQHPAPSITEQDQQLFIELEEAFNLELDGIGLAYPLPDTAWYIRDHIETAYLRGEFSRLNEMDVGNVEVAITKLTHTVLSVSRNAQLKALASCYAASLDQQAERVLLHFRNIHPSDYTERLLKTVLISASAKRDSSVIEHCLGELCRFDRIYLSQYADHLYANNRIFDAIQAYTSYLQVVPEDITTWLRLGEIYQKIEEPELAKMTYQFIVELDPENSIAREFLSGQSNS